MCWLRLMSHDYPGNIRELENILEYAFVLCHDGQIERQHLPPWLRGPQESDPGCCHEGLTLRDLEAIYIRDTLHRCNGNRAEAARSWESIRAHSSASSSRSEFPPKQQTDAAERYWSRKPK